MCILYTTLCKLYKSTTASALYCMCFGFQYLLFGTDCVLRVCSVLPYAFQCSLQTVTRYLPVFFHSDLETVLPQELRLPHVLPLREAIGDPDAMEVLDAFLQLLFWSHLLLVCFPLCGLSLTHAEGSHTEHVCLAAHLGLMQHVHWAFGHGTVQRLNLGLSAHGATDHSSLWGAGL